MSPGSLPSGKPIRPRSSSNPPATSSTSPNPIRSRPRSFMLLFYGEWLTLQKVRLTSPPRPLGHPLNIRPRHFHLLGSTLASPHGAAVDQVGQLRQQNLQPLDLRLAWRHRLPKELFSFPSQICPSRQAEGAQHAGELVGRVDRTTLGSLVQTVVYQQLARRTQQRRAF